MPGRTESVFDNDNDNDNEFNKCYPNEQLESGNLISTPIIHHCAAEGTDRLPVFQHLSQGQGPNPLAPKVTRA